MTTKTVQSSLLATLITVASSHAAITWNFDDGAATPAPDLNGWTITHQNPGSTGPIFQATSDTWSDIATAPVLSTIFDADGTNQENNEFTLIARSPTFKIDAAGSITWIAAGGVNIAPTLTGTAGNYTATGTKGFIGIVLIDASDDSIVNYVSNFARTTSEQRSIDVTSLVNNGKSYFLEAVDTAPGDAGWDLAEWDSFSVPGAVVVPEPSSFLFGCSGLLVLLRRRRA